MAQPGAGGGAARCGAGHGATGVRGSAGCCRSGGWLPTRAATARTASPLSRSSGELGEVGRVDERHVVQGERHGSSAASVQDRPRGGARRGGCDGGRAQSATAWASAAARASPSGGRARRRGPRDGARPRRGRAASAGPPAGPGPRTGPRERASAVRRSAAERYRLRLESARPSSSRTVGTPTISTREVEVAHHPPDQRELLGVLLPEERRRRAR